MRQGSKDIREEQHDGKQELDLVLTLRQSTEQSGQPQRQNGIKSQQLDNESASLQAPQRMNHINRATAMRLPRMIAAWEEKSEGWLALDGRILKNDISIAVWYLGNFNFSGRFLVQHGKQANLAATDDSKNGNVGAAMENTFNIQATDRKNTFILRHKGWERKSSDEIPMAGGQTRPAATGPPT